jgi:voltage-gated potassium channel
MADGRMDVEQWEAVTEWPLAGLAVVFLVAYALPILDTRLGNGTRHALHVVDVVVWVGFALDYVGRLWLARRWHYFWTHLLDLAMVALPALRPLRLLRLLMLLRVLNRKAEQSLHGRVATYVGGSAVLLVLCAALAELDAERGRHGANIETFGDAVWWAVTTVSTVGYGDRYPVTTEGRAVAIGLMLGGVALLGVVTATIASYLIDRVKDVQEDAEAVTRADLADLAARIDAQRAGSGLIELASLRREGLLTDEEFTAAKARLLAD